MCVVTQVPVVDGIMTRAVTDSQSRLLDPCEAMNDLLRSHFRVDGLPKQKLTREEAALVADIKGRPYNSYLCDFCDGWHIGKDSRGKRKPKKADLHKER